MANLLIDIGNTALKASWADGMTLGKTFRYQGEKKFSFILSQTLKEKPEIMVISNVRSFSDKEVERLKNECRKLIIVDKDILKERNLPEYLTPDRAASIIASRYFFIPFFPDIIIPPNVVLSFSYIRGLFVYCPFLLDLFKVCCFSFYIRRI